MLYVSFGTLLGRLEKSAAETKAAKEEIEEVEQRAGTRVQQRTAELQTAT